MELNVTTVAGRNLVRKNNFKKYTVREETKDGWKISCSKGKWDVTGPTERGVEKEAVLIFLGFFNAGEYDE